MLAKPAATLPAGSALPGGTVYEPKWDGYRAILERTREGCRVWSRNGADLTAGFPDIVDAACAQLQPGTVVDGELVVWSEGRLDFAALAPRLAYRGRRRPPAQLAPAAFLAFDLLAADDADVRGGAFAGAAIAARAARRSLAATAAADPADRRPRPGEAVAG